MSEKPKKPQRNSKKITLNISKRWKDIVEDVDKKEVPIQVLEKLNVNLKDGTIVVVDIKKLLAEGVDHEELEAHVTSRLEELDMYIENVDFFVDLNMVEKTVQPETDRLLNKL